MRRTFEDGFFLFSAAGRGGGRGYRPGLQARGAPPMKGLFTRKLRLRPSILTLFVLLTVPVFFTIIAVTYLSNETIARSNAEELVERFRVGAVEDIQNVFDPIKSLVRSAAVAGDAQPEFYSDN